MWIFLIQRPFRFDLRNVYPSVTSFPSPTEYIDRSQTTKCQLFCGHNSVNFHLLKIESCAYIINKRLTTFCSRYEPDKSSENSSVVTFVPIFNSRLSFLKISVFLPVWCRMVLVTRPPTWLQSALQRMRNCYSDFALGISYTVAINFCFWNAKPFCLYPSFVLSLIVSVTTENEALHKFLHYTKFFLLHQ